MPFLHSRLSVLRIPLIAVMMLVIIFSVPGFTQEYLVLSGQFDFRGDAEMETARLAARGMPAQLVDGSQYERLGPGIWSVGLGAFHSAEAAEKEAAVWRAGGFPAVTVRAGRYIGIARDSKVKSKQDRFIIVDEITADREVAIRRQRQLQDQGFLPRLIAGADFENLHPEMLYLVLDVAVSREAGDSRSRESFRDLKDLQILRSGYYRGRRKDPLTGLEDHWSDTLKWRQKYREAQHLRGLGDKGLALAAFRECLKLAPEHVTCRLETIRILVEREAWPEARPEIERLNDLAPDPELDYYLCLIRMETDRENRLAHFREFRDKHPRSPFLVTLGKRAGLEE